MKTVEAVAWCVAVALLAVCPGCTSIPHEQPSDEAGLDDPLVAALLAKDYPTAARMLRGGYPAGGRAVFEQAPAYWAIAEGNADALRLLIQFGLNVNHEWGQGRGNLLTNAVQFGHIDQVRLLVDSGASLIRHPIYGRSALYAAVIYDRKDIEEYLRKHGAKFNEWDLKAQKVLGVGTH